MATEIERKFLLRDDNWRGEAGAGHVMRQGYFAGPGKQGQQRASIRVRVAGDSAYLNIKSFELGVSRQEFEYPVPLADAEQLLALCEKPLIEKTRYYIEYAGHTWEVDVFSGDNVGLVVAEIELGSEDEAFEKPSWIGDEVSGEERYYNVCLARHPYKDW